MSKIILKSFGFRHGLPSDHGQIRDVRDLHSPLPEHMRGWTGRHPEVHAHLMRDPHALTVIREIVAVALALETHHGPYGTDAVLWVGDSGGKNRSVAIAETAATKLGTIPGVTVAVEHRDIDTPVLPPKS